LSKPLIDSDIDITRFSIASKNANRRKQRGLNAQEPICTVKCVFCGMRSLFRLDLRATAAVGARVYRISGLAYSQTVKNGVGLVIQDGRIVGRMISGTRACGCTRTEIVRILGPLFRRM
jgi:hypothetical protein